VEPVTGPVLVEQGGAAAPQSRARDAAGSIADPFSVAVKFDRAAPVVRTGRRSAADGAVRRGAGRADVRGERRHEWARCMPGHRVLNRGKGTYRPTVTTVDGSTISTLFKLR
jgi:hypothetical protein